MLARITSRELTEWEAYENVAGPIGDERLDQLFGMLQATIANVNRSKRTRPYQTQQFLPRWGKAPEAQGPMSGEDMLRAVKKINRTLGGAGGGD